MTGSAGGNGSYSAGTLSWNLGTLTAGASGSVTFQATVNAGVADGTVIANSASLSCPATPTPVNSLVNITVTLPVLTLACRANQTSCAPGYPLTYTLTYSDTLCNAGAGTLTDMLPANLTYVPGSATGGGSYNAGTLTWNLSSLTVGNGGSLTFQATVNAGVAANTIIANSASLTSPVTPIAVTSTANVTVQPGVLSLTATANNTGYSPGATITYTLDYNTSQANASNTVLTDLLPANVSYVPGSASTVYNYSGAVICTPTYNAGAVTWNLGALAANSSGSVTFQATVNAGVACGTVITDNASLTCTEVPGGVTGAAAVTVMTPQLMLTNTANQSCFAPGDTITYTLTYYDLLTNAENVTLSNTLPAGLTYVTGSASDGGSYTAGTLSLEPGYHLRQHQLVQLWQLGDLPGHRQCRPGCRHHPRQ